MKKFVLFLCLSLTSQFSNAFELSCQDPSGKIKATFATCDGELEGEISAFESDLIEADGCELGLPEELRPFVKKSKDIVGICLLITTNAGDAELAILKKDSKGRYSVEMKFAELENPSQSKGEVFPCE